MTWVCFHCDAAFTDRARAEEHFGTRQSDAPLCIADQFELVSARKERDEYADIRARALGKSAELRDALRSILSTTPEERQDPGIWFGRVDTARKLIGN